MKTPPASVQEGACAERPDPSSGGCRPLLQADLFDTARQPPDLAVLLAGVDEAGRGPLAGPVCAAAVILMPETGFVGEGGVACSGTPAGITDSKQLSAKRREALFVQIQAQAAAWSIAWASVAEIDRINILQASMLAMQRAILALPLQPSEVLIDGNRCPEGLPCPARAVVGGDASEAAIGAASILAKVARDQEMQRLDRRYPVYGFARHKGYPSKAHLEALDRHGPCIHHRRSFNPVRQRLVAD